MSTETSIRVGGGQATDRAQEAAQQVAGQAQEKAQEAAGQAKVKLREQLDQRSSQAAEQINQQVPDLRSVSDTPPQRQAEPCHGKPARAACSERRIANASRTCDHNKSSAHPRNR